MVIYYSLNPYTLHWVIILSIMAKTFSLGICFDSKYLKATGSRRLLKPNFLSKTKSLVFKAFAVNRSLFQFCSSHETLIPLSKLWARLKAITLSGANIGLLFAVILTPVIINSTKVVAIARFKTKYLSPDFFNFQFVY